MTPPVSGSQIDIAKVTEEVLTRGQWRLNAEAEEHPDERAARLYEIECDNAHRRWRETLLYFTASFIVVGLVFLCVYLRLRTDAGEADRRFAETTLTSIFSALLGYLVGKKIEKLP